MTYGVVADLHCHNWSTFSHTTPEGVNSRLATIISELMRAAVAVFDAGGTTLVIAGDIFHVRGSIDPEVLNPVQRAIREILYMGMNIYAIPGNHDLKSDDTDELSSSIQTLAETFSEMGTFRVMNRATPVQIAQAPGLPDLIFGFVPWHSKTAAVLADLAELAKHPHHDKMDVFIHAGIDGVVDGTPSSGLTDEVLGKFGFRGVFAGHYHNHKIMRHGVVSIGATTHHNWGDIGSKAGFLVINDDNDVRFNASHAPRYIDITGMTEEEMRFACPGNYVRFGGPPMLASEVKALREGLISYGALGVSLLPPKQTASARSGAAPTAGKSIDQSVMGYVDAKTDLPPDVDRQALKRRAEETLAKSRQVFDAA